MLGSAPNTPSSLPFDDPRYEACLTSGFDLSGDGKLDTAEFDRLLIDVSPKVTQQSKDLAFQVLDKDDDNVINHYLDSDDDEYPEFLKDFEDSITQNLGTSGKLYRIWG